MNFNEIKRILKLKILKIFIFRGGLYLEIKIFCIQRGQGDLIFRPPWGHKIKIR